MENWDKINAVQKMQDYIVEHLEETITLQALSEASGFSLWHAVRIFKELTKTTPFEYIRLLKLTQTAQRLRDTKDKIVEVALDANFESHDGFTKAFAKQFGMTPREYQKNKPPLYFFTFYPISHYYRYEEGDNQLMEHTVSEIVTVQVVDRPARKLIILRSKKATDYFSYCEEMGCDWEGLMNSIAGKMDEAALLELPQNMVVEGTSSVVAGVEVPMEFAAPLPAEYQVLELPPCQMLYFFGAPFENPDDFPQAIDIVSRFIEHYNPSLQGFRWAPEIAPKFNFGATGTIGAKMAIPVNRL